MESPINTWFDGVDCVPRAWRRKCKTMVMRRNGVMDINAAGSSTIKVSDSAICMGRLSVVAEPLAPIADERRVRGRRGERNRPEQDSEEQIS